MTALIWYCRRLSVTCACTLGMGLRTGPPLRSARDSTAANEGDVVIRVRRVPIEARCDETTSS